MLTILSIGLAAIMALRSYNNAMSTNPEATTATVTRTTQALAVVITIGEAIWAVFEALRNRSRGRFSGGGQQTPLRPSSATFGSRIGGPDGED
ncbi:MAG TPA: hypothetical protein VIT65_22355 [Microlunatus sp.]